MAKNNNALWWIVFIILALVIGYIIGTTVTGNIIKNPASITGSKPAKEGGSETTNLGNKCAPTSTLIFGNFNNVTTTPGTRCQEQYPGSTCVTGLVSIWNSVNNTQILPTGFVKCDVQYSSQQLPLGVTAGVQGLCCSH